MLRSLAAILAAIVLVPAVAVAQTPVATPMPTPTAAERESCDGIPGYIGIVHQAIDRDDRTTVERLDWDDVMVMRPSELHALSETLDRYATLLESIPDDDVPLIMQSSHNARIRAVSVLASAVNAMATGGIIAVLPYDDLVEQTQNDLQAAQAYVKASCGF